ncbi:FHA domain-containing protein, partial [Staphylococcus aureus]
ELSFATEGTPIASWHHVQIDLAPTGAVITDLNSTNGTFLNEEQIQAPKPLTVGDIIRLGRRGPKMQVVELQLTEPRPAVKRPSTLDP